MLAPSVTGAARRLAVFLQSTSAHEITELRLGKKTEELYAQAVKLLQLDRHAHDTPAVRSTDTRSITSAPPACRSSSSAVV